MSVRSILKKIFAFTALILLVSAGIADVFAQELNNEIEYTFGDTITFQLEVEDAAALEAANLLFRALPLGETAVIAADVSTISAGQHILTVTHDLTINPMPPFSDIEYWWVLNTDVGEDIETERRRFQYEDNRFDWHETTRNKITAHWHAGEIAFGQAAADVANTALNEIAAQLDVAKPEHLDLYIYADSENLRTGLRLGGRDWVAGHADPDLGVVLATIPPGVEQLLMMRRVIPHEITHLLIHEKVGGNNTGVPGWLNEGLAVINESDRNLVYTQVLDAALADESLLPLASLCGSFPTGSDKAVLAYAQSGSLLDFVSERYGNSNIGDLLAVYADGASCDGGVQRVLQTDLSGLQAEWERTELRTSPLYDMVRSSLPALLLLLLPALSLAALALPLRQKLD